MSGLPVPPGHWLDPNAREAWANYHARLIKPDPIDLNALADRLDDLAEGLNADCHSMHGDGHELSEWDPSPTCCRWQRERHDCRAAARIVRAVAAAGFPDRDRWYGSLWTDLNDACTAVEES